MYLERAVSSGLTYYVMHSFFIALVLLMDYPPAIVVNRTSSYKFCHRLGSAPWQSELGRLVGFLFQTGQSV